MTPPHRCSARPEDARILDDLEVVRDWLDRVLRGELIPDVDLVDALIETMLAARSLAADADAPPRLGAPPEWAIAHVETVLRLDSARRTLTALVRSDEPVDPRIVESVGRLVAAARRWADLSRTLAA